MTRDYIVGLLTGACMAAIVIDYLHMRYQRSRTKRSRKEGE
jgi:hypothetical protein